MPSVGRYQVPFLAHTFFSTLPMCIWRIIISRANSLGHAVTMTLFAIDHNALMATIPTELGLLTNLSTFWVDVNDRTGTIPSEFARLTKFESFTFEKNLLTGSANDALCSPNRLWTTLEGDCLLDEDGQVEIECSCCTTFCNDATNN